MIRRPLTLLLLLWLFSGTVLAQTVKWYQLPTTNVAASTNYVLIGVHSGTNGYKAVRLDNFANSLGATNFYVADTLGQILLVATNGNNTTARRGSLMPFADPYAAKLAATNGDTIIVLPGAYWTNNLLKNGVDWFWDPGATVTYRDTNGSVAPGIFDDRYVGAVTSNIAGSGRFYMLAASNDTANLNLLGNVVTTNPATELNIQCEGLDATLHDLNLQAVVNVKHCRRVYVDCDEITDPLPRTTYFYDDQDLTQVGAVTTAIYWEHGELHTRVKRIWVPGYCLYGIESGAAAAAENWTHEGDYLDNEEPASGAAHSTCIYTVGVSGNWKFWVKNLTELRSGGAVAVTHFGGGRVYYDALKYSTTNASGKVFQFAGAIPGACEAWITGQKASAKTRWLEINSPQTGTVDIQIQQYEDTAGTVNNGFAVASGNLFVHGGRAAATNGTEVAHTGGTARFEGVRLGRPGRTNSPVNVSTNGLTLANCTLLSTNTFFAITTSLNATQSVALQNVFATGGMTNKVTNAVVIGTYGPLNSSGAVQ